MESENYVYCDESGNIFVVRNVDGEVMSAGVPVTVDVGNKSALPNTNNEVMSPGAPSTVDVTNESATNNNEKSKWSDQQVRMLINAYSSYKDQMTSNILRKDVVWQRISEDLKASGLNKNANVCKFKFQHLKRQYIATKDHSNKTGVSPRKFKFYDELEEIFGGDASSSLEPNISTLNDEESVLEGDESASRSPTTTIGKRRRETGAELLARVFKESEQSRQRQEDTRIKLLTEQNERLKDLTEAVREGNRIQQSLMLKILEKL